MQPDWAMLTKQQRVLVAAKDILGVCAFLGLCGIWLLGFYLIGKFVHLTVWHWLIVGLIVFNVLALGLVIVDALCDEKQKEEVIGAVAVLGFTGFVAGLVWAAVVWYLPLLWKVLTVGRLSF